MLLAVENQRDHGAEPGPAVADALQVAEQEFVVGGEVVPVGGVAGRVHTRCTAQCFDFESRVVGEAVAARAVMNVAGFCEAFPAMVSCCSGISSVMPTERGVTSSKSGPRTACTSLNLWALLVAKMIS